MAGKLTATFVKKTLKPGKYADGGNLDDMETNFRAAKRRVQTHVDSGRAVVVRMTSLEAAHSGLFEPRSVDAVYIDANHAYRHVLADLVAWSPKVRHGGL